MALAKQHMLHMQLLSACFIMLCIGSLQLTEAEEVEDLTDLSLAVLAPITSLSQGFLAVAIAFDLDLRKHFEPDLRDRLGAPVVDIGSVHPELRHLRLCIATSHSSAVIAMDAVRNWTQSSSSTVAAVIAEHSSALSAATALLTGESAVPQTSWAASGSQLSDKLLYPYFSRTVAADAVQGEAMWTWMQTLQVPSAAFVHSQEAYGAGLFQLISAAASRVGLASRINGVALGPDAQREDALFACQSVLTTGTRFVMIAIAGPINTFLLAMEEEGLLYSSYQLLSSASAVVFPHGMPMGFQQFHPAEAGPLINRFADFWQRLTPDDIYGPDAIDRYGLDSFAVPLDTASSTVLTHHDFVSLASLQNSTSYASLLFDALYAHAFAINALLLKNVSLERSRGEVLLAELRQTQFEGISGHVAFDANGDRAGSTYHLWNNLASSQEGDEEPRWQRIASYPAGGELVFTETPRWAPQGQVGMVPPEILLACAPGFERASGSDSNLCVRCTPGTGCGYQPSDGFPIGIGVPITSLRQDYLVAIVAFDLDFRKNFEPELVQRFGPPVVALPGPIHPDLRLKLQVGTTHSSVSIGMQTALEWLQGTEPFSKVVGLVLGLFSAVAIPVASVASAVETPVMGYAASVPTLSDVSQYPYFLRVISSDAGQGEAMWAWTRVFGIPAVSVLYVVVAYGEGIFRGVLEPAIADGLSNVVRGIAIPASLSGAVDLDESEEGVRALRLSGTRFVILAMGRQKATAIMYVMELHNMLYGAQAYQILGGHFIDLDRFGPYQPSRGLPLGFMKLQPASQGQLFPRFVELWRSLTLEDCVGDAAFARYMLEYLKVPLSEAVSRPLTNQTLSAGPGNFQLPLLFDALYTYAVAINDLLNNGTKATEIHGEVLLQQLQRTTFLGVSGQVSFDANGDRPGLFDLFNSKANGAAYERVASYDASVGLFAPLGGPAGHAVFLTWAAGYYGESAPYGLIACEAGMRWDARQVMCLRCPSGWISQGGLYVECEPCPIGSTSSMDATFCEFCQPGRFSALGGRNCTECVAGTFATSSGASACEACGVGNFSAADGAVECEQCGANRQFPDNFATMKTLAVNGEVQYSYVLGADSAHFCGCDRGKRKDNLTGECIFCSEGLLCPGLDMVFVQQGYYSSDTEISVYKCLGDDRRCVGGLPGDSCALGRRGVTCAECEAMMTPTPEGPCQPCDDSDKIPFFLAMFTVALGLITFYTFTASHKGKSPGLSLVLCGIAGGQLFAAMQQMGVVGMMAIEWKDPLKSLLEVVSLLTFDVGFLRLTCIGSAKPLQTYLLKLSMLLMALAFIVIFHFLKVATMNRMRFRAKMWSLTAAVAALLMVFYIAVASIVLEPLQCKQHPNRKWTVFSYPSIVCWESDEHIMMLSMSAVVFMLLPVGFLVAVAAIVWQLPYRMQMADVRFVRAFSFLFFRFRPGAHWYLVVNLAKGLFLALGLVIPDIIAAKVYLEFVLFIGLLATVLARPWRLQQGNLLDALLGACMHTVVILGFFFVDDHDVSTLTLSWICFVVVLAGISGIPFAIAYGVWKKYIRQTKPFEFFLCHHKAGAGAFTRLLKITLLELPRLSGDVFIDSDNLHNLDHLFDYIRSETKTLVVVVSADIFTRAWCLGEMTTAHMETISTLALLMPGCKLPDDNFLASIMQEGVPQMEVLTENGMDLELVEVTLRWVCTVPHQDVSRGLDHSTMHGLAERLKARFAAAPSVQVDNSSGAQVRAQGSLLLSKSCYMAYDTKNLEACAASHVLYKLLLPLHQTEDLVPDIVDTLDKLPDRSPSAILLVICTNGVLENGMCLELFAKMQWQTDKLVPHPVLAEVGFRFPPQDVQPWLEPHAGSLCERDVSSAACFISMLFKEIATLFEAQNASGAVLLVHATEIHRRLQAHNKAMRKNQVGLSTVIRATSQQTAHVASVKTHASDGDSDSGIAKRSMQSGRLKVETGARVSRSCLSDHTDISGGLGSERSQKAELNPKSPKELPPSPLAAKDPFQRATTPEAFQRASTPDHPPAPPSPQPAKTAKEQCEGGGDSEATAAHERQQRDNMAQGPVVLPVAAPPEASPLAVPHLAATWQRLGEARRCHL